MMRPPSKAAAADSGAEARLALEEMQRAHMAFRRNVRGRWGRRGHHGCDRHVSETHGIFPAMAVAAQRVSPLRSDSPPPKPRVRTPSPPSPAPFPLCYTRSCAGT